MSKKTAIAHPKTNAKQQDSKLTQQNGVQEKKAETLPKSNIPTDAKQGTQTGVNSTATSQTGNIAKINSQTELSKETVSKNDARTDNSVALGQAQVSEAKDNLKEGTKLSKSVKNRRTYLEGRILEKDLISVIIPIYKMEKYILKCLVSICRSSYCNLEIICVDDNSPDKSMEIVKEEQLKDDRIKIVTNKENLGLFRARVEGMKVATGNYICFVDADDFVGIDWFRLLHKKITEENSDMVIGNTINVDENNNFNYYNNYRSLTQSHSKLVGEDVFRQFMIQEGACFLWHTVWNKLYTANLIKECLPYFEQIKFHLIMCEDILFSSVFYAHAQSLSFANADAYFYLRHSNASTSTQLPYEKILQNIKDVGQVFTYFKTFLNDYKPNLLKTYSDNYTNLLNRYYRIWCGALIAQNKQDDHQGKAAIMASFGQNKITPPTEHDFYFSELTTPWSQKLDHIKVSLLQKSITVVSFDIFDTLIVRPFYNPTDIYRFVGKFVNKLLPSISEHQFAEIRGFAENIARSRSAVQKPMLEDITLSAIYDCLKELLHIDSETANLIKNEEIRLELKFSKTRKLGKELYELAKHVGKKIVITSDMYLERDTIESLLRMHGFDDYDYLFLSSDRGLLKSTGSLFDDMLRTIKVPASKVLHIGDTWRTDIEMAQKASIQAAFLPKALETFENKLSDVFTGWDLSFYHARRPDDVEQLLPKQDLATRCMIAVAANKWFDNPFEPFQKESNYNADAYHTGYYTMGMHLWKVAKWMLDTAQEKGYKHIVFLARDGYVLKQIFDYICKATNSDITTDYFYASRKSLMPYGIKTAQDLYFTYEYFNMNEKRHTPRKLLKLLEPILKPLDESTTKAYRKEGVLLDRPINGHRNFISVVDAIVKLSFDQQLCDENRAKIKKLFEQRFPANTATFDIGYSGKLQKIISELAGKPIDAFFIHSNGYSTELVAKNAFHVNCFYGFTPTISGIIREFFISKLEPSCIGYDISDGTLKPVFEKKTYSYEATYALNEFQKGAYEFGKDFTDAFAEFLDDIPCRNVDASLPFDHYLMYASQFDRWIFNAAIEEDEIYSGYSAKSFYSLWSWHIADIRAHIGVIAAPDVKLPSTQAPSASSSTNTNDAVKNYLSKFSRFKRALFYFLFDRKLFKTKLKQNRQNKKRNKNK